MLPALKCGVKLTTLLQPFVMPSQQCFAEKGREEWHVEKLCERNVQGMLWLLCFVT
jgi:hypothetical protein